MTQAARSIDTRRRLLDAAVEVFAEEGYRQATLQEISRRAGTNIAAANYHFGGKDRLYAAVFEHAERRGPVDPLAIPASSPPEERLRAHVTGFLSRLLDPGRPAWFARLLAREMVEPTRALDRLVRRRMRANHAQLSAIMQELLGPAATARRVRFCTLSVIAQCVFYRNSAEVLTRLYPDLVPAREIAAIAEHVSEFSLAAIRGLRNAASRNGRRR
ncbi:MAG TPA: CerR family C-terminal domain-containing protein [Candidatus Binatia bacterium]|nr:CerR family C-terminal domain-containing protein [Candidatus Binatia bacterium]